MVFTYSLSVCIHIPNFLLISLAIKLKEQYVVITFSTVHIYQISSNFRIFFWICSIILGYRNFSSLIFHSHINNKSTMKYRKKLHTNHHFAWFEIIIDQIFMVKLQIVESVHMEIITYVFFHGKGSIIVCKFDTLKECTMDVRFCSIQMRSYIDFSYERLFHTWLIHFKNIFSPKSPFHIHKR